VPLDVTFVQAHRRIDRLDAGISEAFVDITLGGCRSVATLYRPLGRAQRPTAGWVICHSFGGEQTTMMEHEVAAARAVATAGMPVLRFQGRGYGDAEGDPRAIGLDTHLADAASAVEHLAGEQGIDRVGVIGGRFGGLVAALTAEHHGLPLMVLWEPVVDGARCMRDLLRSAVIQDMTRELQRAERDRSAGVAPGPAPGRPDPLTELRAQGWADIAGFVLTEEAHRDIATVDLRSRMRSFRGEALLVSVARSASPSSDSSGLANHLRSIGAACDEAVIADQQSGNFGQVHHGRVDDLRPKTDLQAPLEAKLAEATAAWCLERAHTATPAGPSGAQP
jgi:pimeloyl-ACP methyl ester carboxylesterase